MNIAGLPALRREQKAFVRTIYPSFHDDSRFLQLTYGAMMLVTSKWLYKAATAVLLLAGLATTPATAASFDCKKAQSPLEN